jgi:Orotidine 5'-phosphate decarboxylase / HUMPS family
MKRQETSHIDRRSFLASAGRFAVGGLAAGAIVETMPSATWARQVTNETHAASALALNRVKTGFTFQISVDVATIELGLSVAGAAVAGGANIIEMGTPLLKNQGVANVVPAFRKRFPEALLLADMKTMDGGAFEARAVFAGGGNIVDFLALAGVDTAKSICAVRDEFRRTSPTLPRLVFADSGAAPGPGRSGRRGRASHARSRRGRGRHPPPGRRPAG